MTTHLRDIGTLVGRTIIGIEVEDSDVELLLDDESEYMLSGIGDIEGDLANLCDTEIQTAMFMASDPSFLLETKEGVVRFFHVEWQDAQLLRIL